MDAKVPSKFEISFLGVLDKLTLGYHLMNSKCGTKMKTLQWLLHSLPPFPFLPLHRQSQAEPINEHTQRGLEIDET
jgi:hypothetical protein